MEAPQRRLSICVTSARAFFSHFLPQKKWGLRPMGLYMVLEAGWLRGPKDWGYRGNVSTPGLSETFQVRTTGQQREG